MLLAGDAMGHSQNGNNNAYCQDNELSWLNWELKDEDRNLLAFTKMIIALRENHPVFRRRKFFQGRAIKGAEVKDILWLRPDGQEMTDEEWHQQSAQCLGLFLAGDGLDEVDERSRPIKDESFLVLMNASHESANFTLPPLPTGFQWVAVVDTACEPSGVPDCHERDQHKFALEARSLAVLVARDAHTPRSRALLEAGAPRYLPRDRKSLDEPPDEGVPA